jgi:hypothetical protein
MYALRAARYFGRGSRKPAPASVRRPLRLAITASRSVVAALRTSS